MATPARDVEERRAKAVQLQVAAKDAKTKQSLVEAYMAYVQKLRKRPDDLPAADSKADGTTPAKDITEAEAMDFLAKANRTPPLLTFRSPEETDHFFQAQAAEKKAFIALEIDLSNGQPTGEFYFSDGNGSAIKCNKPNDPNIALFLSKNSEKILTNPALCKTIIEQIKTHNDKTKPMELAQLQKVVAEPPLPADTPPALIPVADTPKRARP